MHKASEIFLNTDNTKKLRGQICFNTMMFPNPFKFLGCVPVKMTWACSLSHFLFLLN